MDFFCSHHQLPDEFVAASSNCGADLADFLAVANISQGMDPLQAVLDAQLQAPLIEPFLF